MYLEDSNALLAVLDGGFATCRILVVGDLMLDRYVSGTVSRISPEAPVPVLRVQEERSCPGGAGNVARNLAELGCQVFCAGIVGADRHAEELRKHFQAAGIDEELMFASAERPTTTKMRVVGAHQQMMRLDWEESCALRNDMRNKLRDRVCIEINKGRYDAVICSDYAKGSLDENVCQAIIKSCHNAKIPVLVDPKGRDFSRYHGATTITPNRGELAAATHLDVSDADGLVAAAQKLREQLDLQFLTYTRSEDGLCVIGKDSVDSIPAQAQEVFDVSGAGDTVISVLAASMAKQASPRIAGILANLAGSIVVGKFGTAPITFWELREGALQLDGGMAHLGKIRDWEQARQRIQAWQKDQHRVVFTNGCFDLIHPGHIRLLERARQFGDRLVVGLNSDASVSRLKGPSRPITSEADRATVLSALSAVDAVVLFEDDTPLELICTVRPDVLVKGADYAIKDIVGAKEVLAWGGSVETIPLVEGKSTSSIAEKIETNSQD